MKNLLISLAILIFILVTLYVLDDDSTKKIKHVKIVSEKIVIRNSNTEIETRSTVVENKNAAVLKTSEDKTFETLQKTLKKESNIENMTFRTNYKDSTSSLKSNYDKSLSDYNSSKKKLKDIENDIKNPKPESRITFDDSHYDDFRRQNNIPEPLERYMERNIDWNTWKSNFINKILDDSVYIKALDDYGLGAWFYYSFNVSSDGSITNVKVISFYLTSEDKAKVTKLIKSYAHKPITKFPAHTKKKSVKVDAAVLLGTQEKRSRPSDFNENEKIRIKY